LVSGGVALAASRISLGEGHAGQGVDPAVAVIRRYAVTADDPWIVPTAWRAWAATSRSMADAAQSTTSSRTFSSRSGHGKSLLGFPVDVEWSLEHVLRDDARGGCTPRLYVHHEGQRRTLASLWIARVGLFRPKLVEQVPNNLPGAFIALTRTNARLASREQMRG
jgi:hypothetical protein